MAEAIQMQLQVVGNSVLEERDGVSLFPICRNSSVQERTSKKIHAIGSTTLGVSQRRRSTSKLECVPMFRLLRNIRTSSLKELQLVAILSVWQDSCAFKIVSLS